MKFWVDDIRPAPEGYIWWKSVNQTITAIKAENEQNTEYMAEAYRALLDGNYYKEKYYYNLAKECEIELIDLDHDAGDYAWDGGDYIEILNWLELTGRNYPIRIHSMNPVGRENMRRIILDNHWKEIE